MVRVVAFLEGIGGMEMFVIGILALLMFGSKRMPELGRAVGRAIREFKRATSGVEENLREAMRDVPSPTIRPPSKPVASRPPPTAARTTGTTATTAAAPKPPTDAAPEDQARRAETAEGGATS